MDGQRYGVLTMSLDLVRMILDLPVGMAVSSFMDMNVEDQRLRQCRLVVTGDKLPLVPEGADPPQITPIHIKVETGKAFLSEFVVSGKTIYRQRMVAGEVRGEWLG